METLQLLFADTANIFRTLKSDDFVFPLCLIAWTFMLILPLKGIDRRDLVTFICYAAWFLATGAILLVALPAKTTQSNPEVFNTILISVTMFVLIIIRWFIFVEPKQEVKAYGTENREKTEAVSN